MLVISYDIKDDKKRSQFSKMLVRNGAIRLQYSVYEVNNSKRIMDNISLRIDEFMKDCEGSDSIIVFDMASIKLKKYGNAIHRDKDIVYF